MNEWLQREGEPTKWYVRFERYRLLGVARSMDAAFRQSTAEERAAKGSKGPQKEVPAQANRHWYAAAEKWQWKARAEAWDRHEQLLESARIEAERAEARRLARENAAKHREQLIQAMSNPLLRAAASFKPEEASLAEMQKLFDTILNQSRLEFEPEPVRRLDVTTGGKGLPPGTFVLSVQSLIQLMNLGYMPEEFGNLFDRVIEEMSNDGSNLTP
ncbi:MAG: hypothetical protein HND46_19790 [Chloroflexi bacterium]|nr:hypothetical protein [Chloroflexota bacterium]NOG65665.1 hypothetical protein [Chloroflexota bacterium]